MSCWFFHCVWEARWGSLAEMVVNSGVGREGERKHYDAVEREAIWMPKGKTGSAETDRLVRDDAVLRSSTPPIGGGTYCFYL